MWVSRLNIARVDEISVWRRVGKTDSVHARGPCTALAAALTRTVPQPCIFYIPTATSGQHFVFCLCHPFGSNSCFFSCVFVFGPRGHIRHTCRAARNSSAALERQFRFYTVYCGECRVCACALSFPRGTVYRTRTFRTVLQSVSRRGARPGNWTYFGMLV